MPTACGYTWPYDLDAIIREESARADVPLDLAYTFIAVESGFDPRAHNTTPPEDSVGLLQLNRNGGQGTGWSVEQLMLPRSNLQLGLPPIAAAAREASATDPSSIGFLYRVAVRSGHPGPVAIDDPRITRTFAVYTCFHRKEWDQMDEVARQKIEHVLALGRVAGVFLAAAAAALDDRQAPSDTRARIKWLVAQWR